jgi:hypothetical protein
LRREAAFNRLTSSTCGTSTAFAGRLPEPYSIGMARRRLARLASDEAARRAHVAAARAAWRSIGRDDLIEELDTEFGAA